MDVQTVTVVIAGISVIIGVINSILASRRAEKNDQLMLETRQAQLFTQIYDWWRSRDGVKAYANYRYKYSRLVQQMGFEEFQKGYTLVGDEGNIETHADQGTLLHFFEGIGVLVKKSLIDVELVEDLLSQRIIWFWEQILGPNIEYVRKITDDPTQYDSIEYLYHEMKREQQATSVNT